MWRNLAGAKAFRYRNAAESGDAILNFETAVENRDPAQRVLPHLRGPLGALDPSLLPGVAVLSRLRHGR
jgi:hypothetical protein